MSTIQNPEPFIDPFSEENVGGVPLDEEALSDSMDGIEFLESSDIPSLSENRVRDIENKGEEVLAGSMVNLDIPQDEFEDKYGLAEEEIPETRDLDESIKGHDSDNLAREQIVKLQEDSAENGKPISKKAAAAKALKTSRNKTTGARFAGVDKNDTAPSAKDKIAKWNETVDPLVEELELDKDREILPQLRDKYNESDENKEIIRKALLKEYSEEEVEKMLGQFNNAEVIKEIEVIRSLDFMNRVAEEDEELFEEMMEAEDIDEFIRERADEVDLFREFIEEQEYAEELSQRALKPEEIPFQDELPTKLTAAATVSLIEAGVTQDVLDELPPEGIAAVEDVVGQGGAKVLGALFSNGVSLNDKEYVGKISGQHVSLNFSERNLYLVGENAADRANQSFYKIDPPTPAGFEKILIHSVGEQNRMPYIAQHGQQAGIIWERLVGDPNDKSFPEAQSINRFRNFLVLLIGEGNPDAEGEGDRLEQLGIITQGVDSVNRSRVDLFVEALEKFVPGGLVMHEGDSPITSDESPGFNFQDALTLAMLWDDNDSDMPDDLGDLKKLTDRRISGDDITEVGYA